MVEDLSTYHNLISNLFKTRDRWGVGPVSTNIRASAVLPGAWLPRRNQSAE